LAGYSFPGFSAPHYTFFPDDLVDVLLPELTGAETKVLLYIIRRTFGFRKDADDISLSQIADGIRTRDGRQLDRGTGLSKSTVTIAVKSLVSKGCLLAIRNRDPRRGDVATTYALRFQADPVSENRTRGSPKIEQAPVRESDTPVLENRGHTSSVDQHCSKQQGLDSLWQQTLQRLEGQMTAANFRTWLKDTQLVLCDERTATIVAPSPFVVDWLRQRFCPLIEKQLADVLGYRVATRFLALAELDGRSTGKDQPAARASSAQG
jgi:hypothetical protein